ncbi:MAG: PKD domain-containing protein, partial [Thermoplasmata archaeon]|nr:PKD domain-containing protein [Thermoplasmata archaeon]
MRHVPVIIIVLILVAASMSGCITSGDENKPPKAFAGEDIEAEVGQEVIFSGSGLDNDGSIVRFRWDFDGDDVWDYTGEIGARIHVYSLPGSFEATLEVEDDEGAKTRASRWVNVTASVTITVDWTGGTGFKVHLPKGMDVTRMEADWSLEGTGPMPITRTFTHDAGLMKINNTTYAFDPGLTSLDEGQFHVVKVRLGQVVVASRTVEVVLTSDTEGQYDAKYINELYDYRQGGENSTSLWWLGNLSIVSRTGWNRGHLSGSGTWNSYSNRTGVVTVEAINLTDVSVETGEGNNWGNPWWRYYGNGSVEQWDQTGFFVFAWVYDFERSVENGSLTGDDWRRVGLYRGLNETNGTFEWTRISMGNQV